MTECSQARERLNRYLSRCGLASRRKADELIAAGRVSVDGSAVRELGFTIDPERSAVTVDGKPVRPPARFKYYAFNKPAGYLCSRGDPFGRPTIYDLLPKSLQDMKYVGRLDQDTEGLLLLTDDGTLIQRLTHPKHGIRRVYLTTVRGRISDAELAPLRRGIELDGERYQPAAVSIFKAGAANGLTRLQVEIAEGKKREVKMLFRAIGRQVAALTRVRFGPIELGGLPPGKFRPLTGQELSQVNK